MIIANFTNSYKPIVGGVTRSVSLFKNAFEGLGHDVHVYCPMISEYEDKEPCVHRLPAIPTDFKIKWPIAIPVPSKSMFTVDFDVVHSQHPFLLGDVAYFIAKLRELPLVYTKHTIYEQYTHYVPYVPQTLMKKIASYYSINYPNKADAVVAPTPEMKRLMRGQGITAKIKVIPTGIDLKQFNERQYDVRKRYRIPKEATVLMHLGRLAPEKNVQFILQMYKKLQNKNTWLMIVGDGPARKNLQKMTKRLGLRNILFTGIVHPEEVQNYYHAANLFVTASKTETQGMVLAEAYAAGLPIVAIAEGGIVDVVKNKKTGILLDESVPEFSAAVSQLLEDKQGFERMKMNALKEAEQYDIMKSAKKMIRLYKSL